MYLHMTARSQSFGREPHPPPVPYACLLRHPPFPKQHLTKSYAGQVLFVVYNLTYHRQVSKRFPLQHPLAEDLTSRRVQRGPNFNMEPMSSDYEDDGPVPTSRFATAGMNSLSRFEATAEADRRASKLYAKNLQQNMNAPGPERLLAMWSNRFYKFREVTLRVE